MEKDLKELIAALSSKMDDWGSKLESRLSGIELGMRKFDTRVQQLESSLELTASAVEVNVKKIRELESRVSFMEMKNREKNLIFYGMEGNGSENPDESRAKIKSLIKDKLQISDEIVISRCRRLSKKDKVPMLVEVPEYCERIKIFKNSFKLRDLKIFVSKDYSPSTREQRRLLIPKWKEFLNKGITAKLRDDKLIVNGTVYRVLNALVSFIAQIRIISTLIKENHIYVIKKEDLYCKLCGGQITDEIYHFTAECGDLEGIPKINNAPYFTRTSKMENLLNDLFPDDDISSEEELHKGTGNYSPIYNNRNRVIINLKDIEEIIVSMQNRKAPGSDNISNNMIKFAYPKISTILHQIFEKDKTSYDVS
ncbi:hypothetical protein LAZ67_1001470 [Cordylochernes scorpioides]|uniref:Reverse transcriptase zinc-binding domain-containing protein n=1 Tax=Cordylochernes scorpioides TaxID=51811 RepID=A0ABY6JWH7_9ARAC|nr:hypothetical protein LAZ67_1001470 [Cordylochernes scorpioides]